MIQYKNFSHKYTSHEAMQNIFALRKDIPFFENALVHWLMIVTILTNLLVLIGLMFYIHPNADLLRLQYNVYFGTSLHAPWWGGYAIVGVGAIFLIIDILLSYMFYTIGERIAAYVVLLGALFTQVALITSAVSVVLNNF